MAVKPNSLNVTCLETLIKTEISRLHKIKVRFNYKLQVRLNSNLMMHISWKGKDEKGYSIQILNEGQQGQLY